MCSESRILYGTRGTTSTPVRSRSPTDAPDQPDLCEKHVKNGYRHGSRKKHAHQRLQTDAVVRVKDEIDVGLTTRGRESLFRRGRGFDRRAAYLYGGHTIQPAHGGSVSMVRGSPNATTTYTIIPIHPMKPAPCRWKHAVRWEKSAKRETPTEGGRDVQWTCDVHCASRCSGRPGWMKEREWEGDACYRTSGG